MKRRDIKVGMAVDYRLAGGRRGKHLGVVTAVGAVVVSYRRPDGSRGIATPVELMPADPGAEPVTADGIRIKRQAEADVVPDQSTCVTPSGYVHHAGFRVGDTVTHLATPVEQAAADRAEGLADAEALWSWASTVTFSDALRAVADRMGARARRTLPDELADAYQAQRQAPADPWALLRAIVDSWPEGGHGSLSSDIAAARAALDAERGQNDG